MKNLLTTMSFLLISQFASAATGVFGSYLQINTGSNTVYELQDYSAPDLTDFQGLDLGDFTTGSTLQISNASALTFKNIGAGDNVTGATLFYRVYSGSPTSFTSAVLNFGSNSTAVDLGGSTFTGGGDQEWRGLAGGNINLLSGITTNGTYSVEVYLQAFTNLGDRFSNNGGSNFIATFEVVPEPSKALFGMMGLFGLFLRRRRA
jgi:MYXO-CTERM domain-containing protein